MVRILHFASLCIILAASAAISTIFVPASKHEASSEAIEFVAFPIGEQRMIRFSAPADLETPGAYENELDRKRRRLDQMRDWCLLTAITGSNLSAKNISQVTYDLPTVRQETFRRIATFEYGETRSRVVGDGDVIALLPRATSPQQRLEYLGHIADEHRKNLGSMPSTIYVFEYVLKPEENQAEIMRQAPLKGADLFTDSYGYYERQIHSRSDLEGFIAETDDLTFAKKSGSQLTLGGRKVLESGYRAIGLEEVATIWRGQQGLPDYQGVGFSLDPRIDVVKATSAFESQILPVLRNHLVDPTFIEKARAILAREIEQDTKAKQAQANEFSSVLLQACTKSADAESCMKVVGQVLWENSFQAARYEGHNLAGTETGMVLFYTDLLMKLWSFDYRGSAPRQVQGFPIQPEMRLSAIYRGDIERAPETRLWLEPLDKAYQITDEHDRVFFARTATRVSARAHSYFTGSDRDTEPNVLNRVFIDWWNDHFEEIAAYEPQYQRLNEIMKWGVLVTWLDLDKNTGLLAFLGNETPDPIQVSRTHRFPDWVTHQSNLRFDRWATLAFDPSDKPRSEYESLAIVPSTAFPFFGEIYFLEGGVSLANRAAVAERAEITGRLSSLDATARRASIDTRLTNLSAGRLRTLEATEFEFKNFSQQAVATLAKPKPSAHLRDAFGEIQNVGFDRMVRRTTDGLLLRTRAEATQASRLVGDVGDLRIVRSQRGFEVGWRSRDLDLGYSLGRQVSVADDPVAMLAANRNVEMSVTLSDDKGYLVKIYGSDRWIKLSAAKGDTTGIAPGYHARVAGTGNKAKPIDVAWLDNQAITAEFETGYIQLAPSEKTAGGFRIECCTRAPPQGANLTQFSTAGQNVRALRDATGRTFIDTGDLPQSVRSDPGTLLGIQRRLDARDIQLARNLEAGEFRQAASELTRNPLEYQARLNRILADGIQSVQHRQFEVALADTDDLIRTYGPIPDLTLHKAVLEVGTGNTERASSSLNSAFARAPNDSRAFFNEVNHRIARAQTVEEQVNYARLAEYAKWQSLPLKSGEIIANGHSGRLTLEVRVPRVQPVQAVQSNKLDEVVSRHDAAVYIHDSPTLNHINPYTPSGVRSLQQLIQSRRVTVYEIEMNDVARFRPALIHDMATDTSYRLAEIGGHVSARLLEQYGRSNSDDDDQEKRRLYVVAEQP